jgi:hypothetical protein
VLNNIFNLQYKRNFGEAVLFYIFSLIFSFGITMVLALVVSILSVKFNSGSFLAAVIPVGLSVGILRAKNRRQVFYMFLAGASFFLGGGSGAILGLIIPAYLTTLSSR